MGHGKRRIPGSVAQWLGPLLLAALVFVMVQACPLRKGANDGSGTDIPAAGEAAGAQAGAGSRSTADGSAEVAAAAPGQLWDSPQPPESVAVAYVGNFHGMQRPCG